jgi:small subunit ribosomal protein S6
MSAFMAKAPATYDLTLLLDVAVEDDQRTRILADIETMIADAGGTIVSAHDWGRRKMEFEIDHKPEAEYHLIQFQSSSDLLERLERTLRITDAVLRHRVIKLKPGTPDPPDLRRAAPSGTTVAEPAEA